MLKSSEMSAKAAVKLLQLFEDAGIDVWLDGGWAVDAALGEQTRPHKDLDIILQMSHLPRLLEVLADRGFRVKEGGTESNFVLADDHALEVDVHAIVFDQSHIRRRSRNNTRLISLSSQMPAVEVDTSSKRLSY